MKTEIAESTNSELVEQIHYEFEVAGENLLLEAQTLLKTDKTAELSAKAERLNKLGFRSSKEVTKASDYSKERSMAEVNAKLIEYYSRVYPMNKFINEASIKRICEKYGIVKGEVEWFIGEVPEKNLQEIENFSIKDEDAAWVKPSVTHHNSTFGSYTDPRKDVDYQFHLDREKSNKVLEQRYKVDVEYYKLAEEEYNNNPSATSRWFDMSRPSAPTLLPSCTKKGFKMVAPVSDFDTKKFDLKKTGYDLSKVVDEPDFTINHVIQDPIVSQPVRGGYLIVSAWGDEASDPDVVNQLFN